VSAIGLGRALVTGAGRGIGRGTALALADVGYEVICAARTTSEIEELVVEIETGGGTARRATIDVTDAAALSDLDVDGVTVLVNSAGGNIPEPFVNVSEEHLDQIVGVNLKGTFLVSQTVVRSMRAAGTAGVIVNVSSQMGHVGAPERTVYCATKHAVEGLTKAMAVELAPDGIRVNTVAPTFIETPMIAPYFSDPDFRRGVLERIPLGHIGAVADVVAAIRFLVSEDARMITGTSLVVDGGWTAQ
jgi:NAD(P)-dependent dehydrogenase (short-subunit alcohol dehydrogenase family)